MLEVLDALSQGFANAGQFAAAEQYQCKHHN